MLPPNRTPPLPALLLAAVLPLAASCGEAHADFVVHGATVVVRASAPFARSADLPERVEGTLGAALAYWGGSWAHLSGRRITVLDGPYVPCGGLSAAIGCFDGDLAISASDPGAGTFACVEQTVLVHEVGHAVIGDGAHRDPRWMDFEGVRTALAGHTGYGDGGSGPCDLAVSVWRHPPDER